MAITAEMVKQLREKTGAAMMDCKKALQDASGDEQKAVQLLREKGMAVAAKREGKTASEGLVEQYIHTGGKIGVLVELNCETDFVARTDDFKELAKELAMHISWTKPEYISRAEIPAEVIEREKAIHMQWAQNEGKPEAALPKIVEGRMEKLFFQVVCLLDQPFIKDQDRSIGDVISEKVGKLGEKIVVKRFVRLRVGEDA
ncbi:MAG TPA: translation elongation factor Ts [Armatimonadota bacterium]|jgi:elongation factor Ts